MEFASGPAKFPFVLASIKDIILLRGKLPLTVENHLPPARIALKNCEQRKHTKENKEASCMSVLLRLVIKHCDVVEKQKVFLRCIK